MARKNVILVITLFVAVAALYLYEYRDAFIPRPIQISHTFRQRMAMARRLPAGLAGFAPVIPTFTLAGEFQLTDVKLVRLDELKEKGFAHPLWEMVADTKSYPVRDFFYGRGINGMHPKVPDADPEPLETNVTYRLLVTAGRRKGQHDFTVTAQDVSVPTPE